MGLWAPFSSLETLDWGPQFLIGCCPEAALSFLSCDPLHGQLTAWQLVSAKAARQRKSPRGITILCNMHVHVLTYLHHFAIFYWLEAKSQTHLHLRGSDCIKSQIQGGRDHGATTQSVCHNPPSGPQRFMLFPQSQGPTEAIPLQYLCKVQYLIMRSR